MKALYILFLFLTQSPPALAGLILSPGVGFTAPHGVDEDGVNGAELVKFKSALGINLEAEWSFLNDSISVMAGGSWRGGEALAQYDYANPRNPLDSARVADLKTNSNSMVGFFGPRFRFLNLKYFKAFAGAGLTPGILYLNYNEGQFLLSNNGSSAGFKEKEEQHLKGTYFEAGVELYSTKGNSLRLLGRKARQRTNAFETLGNKRLHLSTAQAVIQYMHPF